MAARGAKPPFRTALWRLIPAPLVYTEMPCGSPKARAESPPYHGQRCDLLDVPARPLYIRSLLTKAGLATCLKYWLKISAIALAMGVVSGFM